jgi:hypothetical protein
MNEVPSAFIWSGAAQQLHIQPPPPPSITFLVLLFSPLSPLSSTPYCFLIPLNSTLPPVPPPPLIRSLLALLSPTAS